MPESTGNVLIGVGVLTGIGWLLWRAWHRGATGRSPDRTKVAEWLSYYITRGRP